jgi:diketogulonate reductase-like aldo/keto reductase
MQYKTLRNGVLIPMIGFGTWQIAEDICVDAVKTALKVGYRHIDTAAIYRNEQAVGQAIAESGIAREDLFITTKLWNSVRGFEATLDSFEEQCKKLRTNYIDLYLLHWPKDNDAESWRAMEELYLKGRIKAIGVSNYHRHHFESLMETAKVKPMVNQLECHPRLVQKDLLDYLEKEEVVMEAYSPLMRGEIMHIPLLKKLSEKYNRSIAQIVLRWNLERGIVVLPKSVTSSRIKENYDIFDFSLSAEDVEAINALNTDTRTGADPDHFDF